MSQVSPEGVTRQNEQSSAVVAAAAWHGLGWLLVANLIGVWLAVLLLIPSAGQWLGEWTYGRWMPVHLNFQLYGWISLPLVAWLLRLYKANREPCALWSKAALWMWSLALTLGGFSWLDGHASGKLFLDWSGYNRVYFPLAILFLWMVLAYAFVKARYASGDGTLARSAKLLGLCFLLLVPFAIYAAADPSMYPPINPDSGGPTGASQLESVLVIVLLLFLLPYGLSERKLLRNRWIPVAWIVFAIEVMLCFGLGRGDISHHRPTQFISLGSLLVWVPLVPAYSSGFTWDERTRWWRGAVLFWWALLVPTGWCLFLPGVLDHLKFTDGLVSHSLMAMAGFVTSLLILVLIALLEEDGKVFNSRWAFATWHGATLIYVGIMLYAGWIEGNDPTFTMVRSTTRDLLYFTRLLCGVAMTLSSANWMLQLTLVMRAKALKRWQASAPMPHPYRAFPGR